MARDLEDQIKSIIEDTFIIVYQMKGGINYQDVMDMTLFEKSVLVEFLQKHHEATERQMKKASGRRVIS